MGTREVGSLNQVMSGEWKGNGGAQGQEEAVHYPSV